MLDYLFVSPLLMEERNALADSGTLRLHIGHNTCCFLDFSVPVSFSLCVCACVCDEIDTLVMCGSFEMELGTQGRQRHDNYHARWVREWVVGLLYHKF